MVHLFKYLFIFFLIYLVIRAIGRIILASFVNKQNSNFKNQQDAYRRDARKKEGDVTVKYKPNDKKTIDKDEGDYIDYTEVE